MQQLNLPDYTFEFKRENNQIFIRDVIRKKFLQLSPEEWVRQNLIMYLIGEKKFPPTLFSIESGIKVNTLQKRYDVLVYSKSGNPFVLIECKAPEVILNQKVFEQIAIYNSKIKAPNMMVSNGLTHYFLKYNSNTSKFEFEKTIPLFGELAGE